MKHLFLLLFLSPLWLTAQIEIEVLPPEETPGVSDGASSPEGSGHSAREVRLEDTLSFFDGNELSGQLMELGDEEGGVVWKHPDAMGPVTFITDNLKEIWLREHPDADQELSGLSKVVLTNGDTYRGNIETLEDGALTLSSTVAGSLTLQANMIEALFPTTASSHYYEGPASEEEWDFHNLEGTDASWKYDQGKLVATSRNLSAVLQPEELPDQYSLHFDLEWKGMLNIQIGFWATNTNSPNSNSQVVNLQSNYMRAYRNYNNIGRNNFTNKQIQPELNAGKCRLTFLLNKAEKEIIFLVDGLVIGQWRDAFDGEIPGDDILFYTQTPSPVRISKMSIREWDGELRASEEKVETSLDRLVTVTGDEFMGELQGIRRGEARFKNEFADFSVPLNRIGEIRFSSTSRAEPRLMEKDMKLETGSGETVTLAVTEITAGSVRGTSETTGPVEANLRYFGRVQLNPYDERHLEQEFSW